MSARLDSEVLRHLEEMHRVLVQSTASLADAADFAPDRETYAEDFDAEEILPPRRLFLRVF